MAKKTNGSRKNQAQQDSQSTLIDDEDADALLGGDEPTQDESQPEGGDEASDEANDEANEEAQPEGTDEGGEVEWSGPHMGQMFPVASIAPNGSRNHSEESIKMLAKSIKATGLRHAITIGSDNRVVCGDGRLAAYKLLGYDKIPAQYAVHPKTGEVLASTEAATLAMTIAENVARTDISPLELAKQVQDAIATKMFTDQADAAKALGISTAQISKAISLAAKSGKLLEQMLADGLISPEVAYRLATKASTAAELESMLRTLLEASNGKAVTAAAANSAVQSSGTRRAAGKAGRKPSVGSVSPASLNFDATGIAVTLKRETGTDKGGKGGHTITARISIHTDPADFAKFDLAKAIAKAFAKVSATDVATELENIRKSLA
jgi:ParB/RepB/Spo0J family partition protein